MSIESPVHLDNTPNLNRYPPFDLYRQKMDDNSGLMRIGLNTEAEYEHAINTAARMVEVVGLGLVPLAMTNGELRAFDTNFVPEDTEIALIPKTVPFTSALEMKDGLIPSQIQIPPELLDRILAGDRETYALVKALHESLSDSLAVGNGIPEYMFLSRYFVDGDSRTAIPAIDEMKTQSGHVVTSDRKWMHEHLEHLQQLHTDVFTNQTVQTGYYGGLSDDDVDKFVHDEEFIPIAAYDPTTDEPLMLTLFSPNFHNFASIPWVNPRAVSRELESSQDQNSTLCLPLVVTSKNEGLGLFSVAAEMATRQAVARTGANVYNVLYESNGMSIGFTPKIIHRTLTRLGMQHVASIAQSTFYEVGSLNNLRP